MQSFKIYRGPQPISIDTYRVELRNEKGVVVETKTFSADNYSEYDTPQWPNEEFPFRAGENEYSLRISPIFDVESFKKFDDIPPEASTVQLQIKMAIGVRWRDRHSAQKLRASLQSARGAVISQK